MNRKFKQRPLKTMNAALQRAGQSLSAITPNRRSCLVAVTRCQDFIMWLKKTIAGDARDARGTVRIYTCDLLEVKTCR